MEYIEVSAKTKEEAIEKASIDLGVPSYELDIQVISEGSTGFLGFGSKPAVIKVRKKEDIEADIEKEEAAEIEAKKPHPKKKKKNHQPKEEGTQEKEAAPKQEKKQSEKSAHEPKEPKPVPERTDEEIAAFKKDAEEFLKGVFEAMGIEVVINSDYDKEEGSLDIDFEGPDMGILIGKRGQTLDSLQYLTSLVVNKENKEYVRVKLDTENYRKRRKDTLENLAKNIASKVKKTKKTIVLEPMNPYERRIIHSALQGNKSVETFSEGSEPYRHIVVKPTRQN